MSTNQPGFEQAAPVVFVVDDDVSMREGLGSLIASAGLQVECFASAREFLLRRESEQPSCLVLDVRMPGISGLELQSRLATSARRIPIIFITAYGDIPMAVRAMKAGAIGFLPKPFPGEDLLGVILQALKQDQLGIEQRTEIYLMRLRRDRLTGRERQVMVQIGRGKLNKQIAAELGVSENTIKVHRSHIMAKMGAATIAELVRMIDRLA